MYRPCVNSCSNNKSSTSTENSLCDACCMRKLHQLPFLNSTTQYNAPLELVHSDLWWHVLVYGKYGNKYYACFIDAYTKYTCIYLLVNKSQTFQVFFFFYN